MRKKTAVLIAVPLALALGLYCLPFASLLGPAGPRDYVYRTFMYSRIAGQAVGDEQSPRLKTERVLSFIRCNEFYTDMPALDATPLNDMLLGHAACDQQSNALALLLFFEGIEGSMLLLRGNDSISHHTVAQVKLNGRLSVFDPLYGILYRDTAGNIADFESIQAGDPRYLTHIRITYDGQNAIVRYTNLFDKKFPPFAWSPPKSKMTGARRTFAAVVGFSRRLFGAFQFNPYQDLFLNRVHHLAQEKFDLDKPDEALYFKARNYQLAGRYAKAVALYKKLLQDYPDSPWAERSSLFLAAGLMRQGRWEQALTQLESPALDNMRSAAWKRVREYYLGWCRFRLSSGPPPPSEADITPEAYYF
ncbi:tetratricopeptide repeat protein [bacterium]|nr:tetratricopeptide repeat protein [bacterium]